MSKNKSVKTFVNAWVHKTWEGIVYSCFLFLLFSIIFAKLTLYPLEAKEFLFFSAATIFGEIIGICQWSVLRFYRVPHAAWWIIVTNIGCILALMVAVFLDFSGEAFSNFYGYRGAIFGGLLSSTQYLFVRRYSPSWQKSVMWIVGTVFTGFMIEALFQILSRVLATDIYYPMVINYLILIWFLIWPPVAVTLAVALSGWMLGLILKDYLD